MSEANPFLLDGDPGRIPASPEGRATQTRALAGRSPAVVLSERSSPRWGSGRSPAHCEAMAQELRS